MFNFTSLFTLVQHNCMSMHLTLTRSLFNIKKAKLNPPIYLHAACIHSFPWNASSANEQSEFASYHESYECHSINTLCGYKRISLNYGRKWTPHFNMFIFRLGIFHSMELKSFCLAQFIPYFLHKSTIGLVSLG